jgi:hypothetical protein
MAATILGLLLLAGPAGGTAGEAGVRERGSGQRFSGSVERIPPHLAKRMRGSSWHRGCPVPLRRLRLLRLTHRGFDHEVHRGQPVVRRGQAEPVLRVLRRLFEAGFPIRRMRLVDRYGGSDRRSMNANNTSAFNCRTATGNPNAWSEHAYGTAIDINPVQNPYVSSSGRVLPRKGERFADRSVRHPGMIRRRDIVVRSFARIGWEWGGTWSSVKDYMHFSLSGR